MFFLLLKGKTDVFKKPAAYLPTQKFFKRNGS